MYIVSGSRTIPLWTMLPGQLPPRTAAPRKIPPGQLPPRTIAPWTITMDNSLLGLLYCSLIIKPGQLQPRAMTITN